MELHRLFAQRPFLYVPNSADTSTAFVSVEDTLHNCGTWRTTSKVIWDIQADVLAAMNSSEDRPQQLNVRGDSWISMTIEYSETWRELFPEFFLNTLQVSLQPEKPDSA